MIKKTLRNAMVLLLSAAMLLPAPAYARDELQNTDPDKYYIETINRMIDMGMDASMISVSPPFNLDIFGVLLGTWIIQLGVSSGAYYVLIKAEHKIELVGI